MDSRWTAKRTQGAKKWYSSLILPSIKVEETALSKAEIIVTLVTGIGTETIPV